MKPRGFLMDCALIKLHTGNPIRFKFFYLVNYVYMKFMISNAQSFSIEAVQTGTNMYSKRPFTIIVKGLFRFMAFSLCADPSSCASYG